MTPGPHAADTTEDETEASRMPLVDHLIELRNRLVISVLALVIAFFGCYFLAAAIYDFLMRPLVLAYDSLGVQGRRMIYTAPQEAFFTYIRIAFWSAVVITFPVIASQFYMFVAPGLYRHEKRVFLPFLCATPVLFALGGGLVYFVVMPMALRFFLGFETSGGPDSLPIVSETRINEYLSLVMTLIFAFGLAFQLPVVLTLLVRAGLVSVSGLKGKRRHAIVGVFIFAAVTTPPDPFSQISLALPMILLYELSIWSATLIARERADGK